MEPTTAFLSGPHGTVDTPSNPSANNTCTGELVDDQWNFQVAGDVRDCNTAIDLNETTIMFSNSVSGIAGVATTKITRERVLQIDLTCNFEKITRVSTADPARTALYDINVYLGGELAEFEIGMALYKDSSFSELVPSDAVLFVPNPLFVGVTMAEAHPNLVIQLEHCWATPIDEPDAEPSYHFINDFCGDSEELSTFHTLSMLTNGVSNFAAFSLASFVFAIEQESNVFFHCDIRVCDSSTGACVPDCNGTKRRRRRDAVGDMSGPISHLTMGPLTFKNNPYSWP